MKTLVFGATGKTGSYVVRELIKKDGVENLVFAVRDIEQAEAKIEAPKSCFRVFDYQDSFTWSGILKDIKHVYMISPPYGEKAIFQGMQLVHLMKEHSVQKIVFLSGRTTGDVEGSLLSKMERIIIESGITYCILRPGWFMQNFTIWFRESIQNEDIILLPAGEGKSAFIDVKNIAEVVYKLFHSKKWNNKILPLTSNESLSHHDVAKIFSDILERKISYMPLPDGEYTHAMSNRKWPKPTIEKMVYLYSFVKAGKEDDISPMYEAILNKKPTSFSDFVKRYKHVWE